MTEKANKTSPDPEEWPNDIGDERDTRLMELEESTEVLDSKLKNLTRKYERARRGLLQVLGASSVGSEAYTMARYELLQIAELELYDEARMEHLKWQMSPTGKNWTRFHKPLRSNDESDETTRN